jgi:hypothetical protein
MSPIDPRELGHGLTPTGEFEDGFRCVKCHYDLSGLPRGTVCPECGTPNARVNYDKKRGTGISRAPLAYINRLGTWLWVAAFLLIGTWFTAMLSGVLPHPVTYGIRFLAGVGWLAAVWFATAPKPDRYEPGSSDAFDDHRLRMATVIGQGLWLVAIALQMAAEFLPAAAGPLRFAAGMVGTLAAAGFVPLGIMLASLANWMGDADAERRCQAASWLIAFYGIGILLASFIKVIGLLYIVFWLAYLAGVILLAMSLFGLAGAANWAMQNAKHKSVVSGRRAVVERQRAVAAEVQLQDRLDALDNRDASMRAGRKAPPKGVPVPKSHTIERPEDADPYEVKDE